MDKETGSSRLKEIDTVQLLAEKHGKFIDKLREAKVWYIHCRCNPQNSIEPNMFFVLFTVCFVPGSHGSTVPQVLQPRSYSVGRPVPSAVESADRKTTTSKLRDIVD